MFYRFCRFLCCLFPNSRAVLFTRFRFNQLCYRKGSLSFASYSFL
nr:MAG TPA: hypothetical protein [Caudoviricetes sp.]